MKERKTDLKQEMEALSKEFLMRNWSEKLDRFLTEMDFSLRLIEALDTFINEDLKGERLAVFGYGGTTKAVFSKIRPPQNLACIIDMSGRTSVLWELREVPVIRLEELKRYQVTAVLTPSRLYEKEMENQLCAAGFQGKVVGIHTWLEEKGFYFAGDLSYIGLDKYKRINEAYCRLKSEGGKYQYLCVIAGLLRICDYTHALPLLNAYMGKGFDDNQSARRLLRGIEDTFSRVKGELSRRKTKHVMMYLVDSLGQDEADQMLCLKKIAHENFSFHNVINQYGTTRESVMSLLTGYQIIKDRLYNQTFFTMDDGTLFPYLRKEGYEFHFLCGMRDYAPASVDVQGLCRKGMETAPEIFFTGLCEALECDGNSFIYMHTVGEMHPPFYSPLHGEPLMGWGECEDYELFLRQYHSGQSYVDELLGFYDALLEGEGITKVFAGDHGIHTWHTFWTDFAKNRRPAEIDRWNRKRHNPAFIVCNHHLKRGRNHNLIANYSLAKIMRQILEESVTGTELEGRSDPFVRLEIIPTYNKQWIDAHMAAGNYKAILGGEGIWTDRDVYMKLETGEEEFYVHGDRENHIHDEKYRESISRSRRLLGDGAGFQIMMEMEWLDYHKKIRNQVLETQGTGEG